MTMWEKQANGEQKTFSWKRVWVVIIAVIVLFGIFFVGLLAYAQSFQDRVVPGVSVGSLPVGGMNEDELHTLLEDVISNRLSDGITFRVETASGHEQVSLYPTVVPNENVIEFFHVDIEREVDALLGYQKVGNPIADTWGIIMSQIQRPRVALSYLEVNHGALLEQIKQTLGEYQQEARNADVRITSRNNDAVQHTVTSSTVGVAFNYDNILGRVTSAWSHLKHPELTVSTTVTEPTIVAADVAKVVDRLPQVFSEGPITITYVDPHTQIEKSWKITEDHFEQWVTVQKTDDERVVLGLDHASTSAFIEEEIVPDVQVEAQNARFEIGDGKRVTAFQGSRPGVTVDVEKTYAMINDAMRQRSMHDEGILSSVPLETKVVEPEVSTSEVNDLGITTVLGSGYSNFAGSPANRVKNIRHAAETKLDGLLIKPGETFSLLEALRPFTIEGGYLPELVIKGDEIKPEIGGGLCQIGSTMFRTAMNAGMPIAERRNHSLVVSYYNDHRNGMPGTDATIYDPAPDFKFTNDTGNYLLITSSMDAATGELYFTLWGTDDGRKGSYTEPVVERWIPAGETKYIETTDLAPGQKKCQARHNGAVTNFTYNRITPDGKKEPRVFESYYRPLPQICLIGVESLSDGDGDEQQAEQQDDQADTSVDQTEDDLKAFLETGKSSDETEDDSETTATNDTASST